MLSRGGSLEGTVVDVRGRPVAGAHVTVLATRGSLERMTRSGTDGSFAFAALPEAITVLVSRDEDVGAGRGAPRGERARSRKEDASRSRSPRRDRRCP